MKSRHTTSSVSSIFAVVLAALSLSACTEHSTGSSYPDDYRSARETQRGISPVPDAYVDDFIGLFQGTHGPETVKRADALYAEDVYFSDTLTNTRNRAKVIAHFERLRNTRTQINLEVHDRIHRGQDVYLIWSMGAAFEAANRDITSNTIGISHLRFNDNGQIILQQDFWDAAHGFYQHLPVLGSALRTVSSGLDG